MIQRKVELQTRLLHDLLVVIPSCYSIHSMEANQRGISKADNGMNRAVCSTEMPLHRQLHMLRFPGPHQAFPVATSARLKRICALPLARLAALSWKGGFKIKTRST